MTTEQRAHTRAFLFADLRGYSAFTERHGDAAAADLIGRYRRVVREQIAVFDGAEIRTEGDSFYVVFDSVGDAVHAGLAIRDAVGQTDDGRGSSIRVGIGIHAGEARDGEHGIVSSAVNIAARVCAVAEPGEVLVTDTVRGLTRTALLVAYTPRGRRRLKGIAEPIALFRAESSAASSTMPARPPGRAALPIAIAGGLAAAAVVVALVASRGGVGGNVLPPASTSASPAVSGTAAATETHDLSRFNDPGPFPNANEMALRDQLLSSVADRCERADPDDTPLFHFLPEEGYPQSTYPLRNRAGLDCLVDGIRVQYWQAVGSGGSSAHIGFASDLFFNTVRRLSLTSGDCATQSQVHEPWEAGAHTGTLLCYVGTDGPVIAWTFEEENVYATARLRNGSSSELYAWWLDTGRLLGR